MFDTTLQPERLALGKALHELGRRDEAYIIAWNFMTVMAPGEKPSRPVEFQPAHLEQLISELQTDYLDAVVIHDLDNGTPDENARQEALAVEWQQAGRVKDLGFWSPVEKDVARFVDDNPFSFMIRPLNAYNATAAAPHFKMSQETLGWKTYACSPFFRGWFLDKMVAQGASRGVTKPQLADLLLRFSLFHSNVDKVVTAIRKREWIAPNVRSAQRGPLSEDENMLIAELAATVEM